MGDQIEVTQSEGAYWARIDGILCAGTGATEAEAIRALAACLGDFVKGHADTIGHMRKMLRELADPPFITGAEAAAKSP